MKLVFIFIFLILSSCTCTLNLVNTRGSASDVVDENATASASLNQK